MKHLTLINDQLCYSALAHYEFGKTIAQLAVNTPKQFSTALFPTNPHSTRLHRTAEDLVEFAAHSEEAASRMAIVLGYEHLAAYFDEAQSFRVANQPSTQDAIHDDAIEEQFRRRLEGWLTRPLDKGYFRTAGYIRHLRNSYAHAHNEPSSELRTYAAKHGHLLNTFWNNGFTDIAGINFQTVIQAPLTTNLAFAFMNLCRICVREIDQLFASTINVDAPLNIAIREVWLRRPELRSRPERIASKARGAILRDYGITLGSQEVLDAVLRFKENEPPGA